jgi:hypothetical protein
MNALLSEVTMTVIQALAPSTVTFPARAVDAVKGVAILTAVLGALDDRSAKLGWDRLGHSVDGS